MNVQDRVVEMRLVPASELSAHPSNWRQHPKAQQRALTAILDEVGFAGAVLARENDDGQLIIIDGHARAEIVGDATIPVLVTDLTEAEAEIVLATYDPIGAMAEKDHEAFATLAARINTGNEALLGLLGRTQDGETDPDDVPDVPEEAQSRTGVVYELGPHRVMCGDATSVDDANQLFQKRKPWLVTTSPPYNVGIKYASHQDEMNMDDYEYMIGRVLTNARRLIHDGGALCWNVGVSPRTRCWWHAFAIENAKFVVQRQIVWAKTGANIPLWQNTIKRPMARHYFPNYRHEILYIASAGEWVEGGSIAPDPVVQHDIWDISQLDRNDGHPAAFPVKVALMVINHLSAKDELVADLFMGSGTTLIAAEQASRICYGMEIDPRYVDVIRQRYADFVGDPSLAPNG